jgi:hypothetical protein
MKIFGGCLMFSHQRVLVAGPGGTVLAIGTWQKGAVVMASPRHSETVPCEEARWTATA